MLQAILRRVLKVCQALPTGIEVQRIVVAGRSRIGGDSSRVEGADRRVGHLVAAGKRSCGVIIKVKHSLAIIGQFKINFFAILQSLRS